MLKKIKRAVLRNLMNIPGWRTDRKIVVFESDDWGSIRMPSREVYEKCLAEGIKVDSSIYDTFDILEQREDLEYLFNMLIKYTDQKGRHPIYTFNTVMGNPNFDLIRKNNFKEYYHEDLFSSYKKYNQDDISYLWDKGIEEKLIEPQFHAKEHLNVSLWMKALRDNHNATKTAFDLGFFGLKTEIPLSTQNNYLAAFWAEDYKDFQNKLEILEEGMEMFESVFGFRSQSFTACNYVYTTQMEKVLNDLGIKFIQTQQGHISPSLKSKQKKIKRHFTGQSNHFNQQFIVRNCFFEPTLYPNDNAVKKCLQEISMAFRWKKPAVISSHRINYVGGMSKRNRDKGLKELEKLLTNILKKWPDAEFLTTTQLGKLILVDYENSYSQKGK